MDQNLISYYINIISDFILCILSFILLSKTDNKALLFIIMSFFLDYILIIFLFLNEFGITVFVLKQSLIYKIEIIIKIISKLFSIIGIIIFIFKRY